MGGELKTREQAAVLALARACRGPWHLVSQLIEEAGSALAITEGRRSGFESPELLAEAGLPDAVAPQTLDELEALIMTVRAGGADLVTVLDESYPTNLRLVFDRPPFLFVRGELRESDDRSIAVVGTRRASEAGLRNAERLAHELAARGVTVLSGLAKGIDGAAHRGALASGGRTVAVIGNGIRSRIYPPEHQAVAEQIVSGGGAIISQFLPDAPPRRQHFPLRNATMSGLAVGTVVVEASSTSGARMQARLALTHGKRVLLWRDLVTREEWAQKYADRPGASVVASVEDVLAVLEQALPPLDRIEQLVLG